MCFLKPHEQSISAKIRCKKSTFYHSLVLLGYGPVVVTKKKNMQYITKCDVKVVTHLNFGRNNVKPAAVTSWGLGGKLRLEGGKLPPQHPPNDAPGVHPTPPLFQNIRSNKYVT